MILVDEDSNERKEEDVVDGREERVPHVPVQVWWLSHLSLLTTFIPQDSVESTDLPEIRVYKRRWYILGLFGLLACHQCLVWNTFGPIESAVQYAYHWSNAEVGSDINYGAMASELQCAGSDARQLGLHHVCHHLDTSHKTSRGK